MKLQESKKIIEGYACKARLDGKKMVYAILLGNDLLIRSTPTNDNDVNTQSLADDSLKISLIQPKHVNGMLVSKDVELEMNTDLQVAVIILQDIQKQLDNEK